MFESLQIHHLRRLEQQKFSFDARYNLIFGPNGAGKTSLLESLYLLSTGHSFRTRETTPLIQSGYDSLTLYAKSFHGQTVSLQKSMSLGTKVLIDDELCRTSALLAKRYPCQVVYQDIFQIIDALSLIHI